MFSRIKESEREKQLYLENTGTKAAKVSDQGQQKSGFRVQNKRIKATKDEGRES